MRERPNAAPTFCGGIDWTVPRWADSWRCGGIMTEFHDGREPVTHQCAASYDHPGDHCCALGHRWPQAKPNRRWRDRIRNWRQR